MMKKFKYGTSLVVSGVMTLAPAIFGAIPAQAAPTGGVPAPYAVAAGCAVPQQSATTPTYYVDPDNGNIGNNGSLTSPWDTLNNVLTFKQSQLVNGATLILYGRPGGKTHGTVQINYLSNNNFITVENASGQTPVLTGLQITGGQNFVFEGLKIQSIKTDWHPLVYIADQYTGVPAKNIILLKNWISSQDNVSTWSPADWRAKASQGLLADGRGGTSCITINNNLFSNVGLGVALMADQTLFISNTINNFGDDAVDFAANNLVITNNQITNNLNLSDGNHNDCMQGQIGPTGQSIPGGNVYNNITITRNVCIAQTNPRLTFPGTIQGIDAFNSNWNNLVVRNNTVIVNAWHGIAFASVHGGIIAENTVLASNPAVNTWITVADNSSEGTPSSNVFVQDNVSTALFVTSAAATVQGNYAQNASLLVNGALDYNLPPGINVGNNDVIPGLYGQFMSFNPAQLVYNLNLTPNSILQSHGSGLVVVTSGQ